MMTNTVLRERVLESCSVRLPEWRKYRSSALYRRTSDFVQWLVFDISAYEVALVPTYSVQALAEQFSAQDLTLGARIRNEREIDLWIRPTLWEEQHDELIERIVTQVDPSAFNPLTIQAVRKFLDRRHIEHTSALTAYGIAALLDGDAVVGKDCLFKAAGQYRRLTADWARVDADRIESWLACDPADLNQMLHDAATRGAAILCI